MADPGEARRADGLPRPGGRVHLMGIGGVGMAALAGLLQDRGYAVDGCDLVDNRLTRRLQARGVAVHAAHHPAHLDPPPDLLVRSSAVPSDHPEIRAARARAIPVLRRGEVLPALLRDGFTVAVSGTHGKTTTTALCAHAVRAVAGPPGFLIGGEWEADGRVYERGSYPVLLVEADESDGTLAGYHPDIALITGIDYDHMEHFADAAAFERVFATVIGQTRMAVVFCGDDPRLCALAAAHAGAVSYGFGPGCRLRAIDVADTPGGSGFTVEWDGAPVARATLPVPGAHNVANALGALAVVQQLGLPLAAAAQSLASFQPVRRRLERVAVRRGVPVYADYAHHPTEIRALLSAVRPRVAGRLLAIFQPHRYTRTRALGAEFPASFAGADRVILAPVYPASEAPLPGGMLADLARHFEAYGRVPFEAAPDLASAWSRCAALAEPGDVLLLIGAGDIEQLAEQCRADTENEPAWGDCV